MTVTITGDRNPNVSTIMAKQSAPIAPQIDHPLRMASTCAPSMTGPPMNVRSYAPLDSARTTARADWSAVADEDWVTNAVTTAIWLSEDHCTNTGAENSGCTAIVATRLDI